MQHETRHTLCNMRRGMQHTTNLTTGRLVTRLVLLGFKPGPLDCPRVHICGHRACAAAAEHTAVRCGASPGGARVPPRQIRAMLVDGDGDVLTSAYAWFDGAPNTVSASEGAIMR